MDTMTISIASLLIALAAVFFGPIIQLKIAKKQTQNQTSLSIRNEWARELRNNIGDYIATIYHHVEIINLFRTQNEHSIMWQEILEEKKKLFQIVKLANQLRFRVMSMLDQQDKIHCVLIDTMNSINDIFYLPASATRDQKLTLLVADLLTATNKIINHTNQKMFEGR